MSKIKDNPLLNDGDANDDSPAATTGPPRNPVEGGLARILGIPIPQPGPRNPIPDCLASIKAAIRDVQAVRDIWADSAVQHHSGAALDSLNALFDTLNDAGGLRLASPGEVADVMGDDEDEDDDE